MSNRRIMLYIVALAGASAVVLGVFDRASLAIVALTVSTTFMFGWAVLWARAQNTELARIGTVMQGVRAELDRSHHALDQQDNQRLPSADGSAREDRSVEAIEATRQYVAERADGQDGRLGRLERQVQAVSFRLQRTPSLTAELSRVYQRIVHHHRPMPELGGWAMTSSTLVWAIDQIETGRISTILECGSGSSTVWLALALEQRGTPGRIVSLESSATYAATTRDSLAELGLGHRADVVFAPLVDLALPDRATQPWFEIVDVPDHITGIDLLFVDGPVGDTAVQARYPALPVLADRLASDAYVLLDDSNRPHEREIVNLWAALPFRDRRFEVYRELDRSTVLRSVYRS